VSKRQLPGLMVKPMNIKISLFQRSNLLQFLKRVQLTGEEVDAYMEVVNLIKNAEEVKEPKE